MLKKKVDMEGVRKTSELDIASRVGRSGEREGGGSDVQVGRSDPLSKIYYDLIGYKCISYDCAGLPCSSTHEFASLLQPNPGSIELQMAAVQTYPGLGFHLV
ncbi:hypothetical protein EU545_00370 [Candidatus Thorarchaeota archaeon]|nr:MAG: hypothetical protein EU545_00370 [Candidatus Thorarchaeota archaeon]